MNARARTILFAIVVLFCAFPSTVWCQEVAEARVVNVTGEAFAMAPGETQWARLQEGERCVVGTRIRCGENAFAILEFAPGHRVKVDENTTIELSEMQYREDSGQEKTLIDLAAGRILNNVRKLRTEDSEYSVRTPTASAAVRGTIYEVRYEEETKRTSVRVLEGLIELEARIGRRLSSRIAEMEKAGVDEAGGLAPVEALSDQEAETLRQSSNETQTAEAETAEGEAAVGSLDALQADVMDRIDAIQERLSDENRAGRMDMFQEEDDDDY